MIGPLPPPTNIQQEIVAIQNGIYTTAVDVASLIAESIKDQEDRKREIEIENQQNAEKTGGK